MALAVAGAGDARAQVPPDEAWRTITTDHFRVTVPERLETLGRRAAAHAERAFARLQASFVQPPSGRIDLVVSDHADFSNGFARVTPSNRIVVYARPPTDDLGLGYFDDWLELVVTHELAHVFHLDRHGTVGTVARALFGRVPVAWPFFPGSGVPRWTTEGMATWYESRLTDAGRTHGTYHEMVLRTAALEGRFERLDQSSGDSPAWPGGDRPYVYGSLFFEHLLDVHGEEKMGAFAEAVAGQWIPYRLDAAGRRTFGRSLSEEWRMWSERIAAEADSIARSIEAMGPVTRPERLTRGARIGGVPRLSPDGSTLAFAYADGRSDAHLRIADPDGAQAERRARLNGTPTFDWLPDGSLLVSQLERNGPYRYFADLYRIDAAGGDQRLTRGARLTHPSVAPSGAWAIAVQEGDGTSGLVRVDLAEAAVTPFVPGEPDVHWSFPAVSPDGRWIAATRWRTGARLDVVVLDLDGRTVLEVTDDRAMDVAPTWAPNGSMLLWMSDRTGIPNLLAAEVDPAAGTVGEARLATNVATGAAYPSVDRDGSWVYFRGYSADGWEVERVPFDPEAWPAAPAPVSRFAPTRAVAAANPGPVGGEIGPYSPFATLVPTYWEPLYREAQESAPVRTDELFLRSRELLGPSIGAQTSGFDLVGRHGYDAFLRVYTRGGKVDGGLAYSFAGLASPVFSLAASQFWNEDGVRVARAEEAAPLDTLFVRARARSLSAAVTFQRPEWRRSAALTLSGGLSWEHRELLDNALEPSTQYRLNRPEQRFADLRATLSLSTARSHAFQMGASDGASLVLRARAKRELSLADSLSGRPRLDGSLDEGLVTVRLFRTLGGPGHAAHVLAFRGSAGHARGAGADAGHFRVGGASGRPERVTGFELFGGSGLRFPVRGYGRSARFGRSAWVASAEYRFPILLVHRGLGAWPLHLDRIAGSLFFDSGNAWGPDLDVPGYSSPRRGTLASVGAELTQEFMTLWTEPLRLRAGVGIPLREGGGAEVYVRVGLAF